MRLLRREIDHPTVRHPRLAQARLLYAYSDLLAQAGDMANARRGFAMAARLDPDGTTAALDRLDEMDGIVLELDETEFIDFGEEDYVDEDREHGNRKVDHAEGEEDVDARSAEHPEEEFEEWDEVESDTWAVEAESDEDEDDMDFAAVILPQAGSQDDLPPVVILPQAGFLDDPHPVVILPQAGSPEQSDSPVVLPQAGSPEQSDSPVVLPQAGSPDESGSGRPVVILPQAGSPTPDSDDSPDADDADDPEDGSGDPDSVRMTPDPDAAEEGDPDSVRMTGSADSSDGPSIDEAGDESDSAEVDE